MNTKFLSEKMIHRIKFLFPEIHIFLKSQPSCKIAKTFLKNLIDNVIIMYSKKGNKIEIANSWKHYFDKVV